MIANDHESLVETFEELRDVMNFINDTMYRGTLTSWDKMIMSNAVLDAEMYECAYSTRTNSVTVNGKVIPYADSRQA